MLTAIRFVAYEREYEAVFSYEYGYFECVHTASNSKTMRRAAGCS